MEVACFVNVGQSLEYLITPGTYARLGKVFSPILHHLVEIVLLQASSADWLFDRQQWYHVFEDEMQFVVLSNDFFESDNKGAPHAFQRLYFAQIHAFFPAIVLSLHCLDGNLLLDACTLWRRLDTVCDDTHHFLRLTVHCSPYTAVSTVSEQL